MAAALVVVALAVAAALEVVDASYAVAIATTQDYIAVRACIVIMQVSLMHLVHKSRPLSSCAFRGRVKAASMLILLIYF